MPSSRSGRATSRPEARSGEVEGDTVLKDGSAPSPPVSRGGRGPRVEGVEALAVGAFVAFVAAVLLAPAAALIWSSVAAGGRMPLAVYARLLARGSYQRAILTSLALATTAAALATAVGALVALAVHRAVGERFRAALLALASVATNYGGLPLVFGFVLLWGTQGMLTLFLGALAGRPLGIELVSFWGLVAIYQYFLIPLCVLTFLPALAALRDELTEAAAVHGARMIQFWRYVGGPILLSPLLASFVLCFAHALGSYTTPWALVGGGSGLTLIPLQIGFLFGEAGFEPETADALAVIVIALVGASLVLYHRMMGRVSRWSRT
jgi:putative spermidine/putrescine transport system permease protein